jgi:DNA-binding LytR/AlgR family response regulator
MHKLYFAVCDDEQTHSDELKRHICNCSLWRGNAITVKQYASGQRLLDDLGFGIAYDYIFLDINMPGISGIDLRNRLSKITESRIIFVSTHMEYQPDVDRFYPAMLLPKPYTHEIFENVIRAYLARCGATRMFKFTQNGESRALPCRDIYYLSMADHHLMIAATGGTYQDASLNLSIAEREYAAEGFYRCHKSYIVNLRYYESHDFNWVYLRCGERIIPIKLSKGKGRGEAVKEAYLRFKIGGRDAF